MPLFGFDSSFSKIHVCLPFFVARDKMLMFSSSSPSVASMTENNNKFDKKFAF